MINQKFKIDKKMKNILQNSLCFGTNKPDYYFSVPVNERAERIELKESLCVLILVGYKLLFQLMEIH